MAQDRGSDRRFLPFAPHPCHKCQIFIGCWLQVLPGVWHCSSIFSWKKSQHHASLVDTDWYRLLNFGVLKKNLKSTQFVELYFGVSGGRVQVWVRVRAPAGNLAIVPEGYSRIQSKVLTAKSMAKLWGCAPAQIGLLDGRAQTQVVSCSAAVAAGCDRLA